MISEDKQGFTVGYNDWKNASSRFTAHERSTTHVTAVQNFNCLKEEKGRIDKCLVREYNAEVAHWHAILHRVVEVIKFLAERGLGFRGQNETIGSKSNGNYLGVLELISKFDQFLSTHRET